MKRVAALVPWCFAVWVLLTWTATMEQLSFGLGIAIVIAVSLSPLGDVVPPWRLLSPTRLWRIARLAGFAVRQIVRANVVLAWRVWHREPPLRTGLVIVPTRLRSDGGLTAVGVISSLIVDNQIIDVDRARHQLLYHAVWVPDGGRRKAYAAINGPLEARLTGLTR